MDCGEAEENLKMQEDTGTFPGVGVMGVSRSKSAGEECGVQQRRHLIPEPSGQDAGMAVGANSLQNELV